MRPLIIGQAPGRDTKAEFPMYPLPKGRAGDRLMKLMGLDMRDYLKLFDRMNLIEWFPGASVDGDKFPMRVARVAATGARPLLAGRTVIMVGRGVSSAFGLDKQEFLEWAEMPVRRRCIVSKAPWKARVAVVPHPSGRSRWYNEGENRELAEKFLRDFVAEL